ncbi:MAG TPA: hypothetical protein VHY08_16870 [Bacillota bacterium]|nr:hypothetical protein [Bacillota bacterium]
MSFKRGGFIQDRFTQGLVAAIIGWVPQMLVMQTLHWIFHATKFQYLDFMAVLAFDRRPHGILEFLFAEFLVVAVLGTAGSIFAMLVKVISSRNLLIKGAIYGGSVWFVLYTIVILYKIEGVYGKIDFPTAFFDMMGAVIYGIFLAWGLLYLERKYGVEN